MTLGLAVVYVAIALIWSGVKSKSFKGLLTGKSEDATNTSLLGQQAAASSGGGSSTTSPGSTSPGPLPTGRNLSSYVSPVQSTARFERVDQGVDYSQVAPYVSPGAGTVTNIAHGWAGGSGQAVYVRLDQPVSVGGRSYSGVYVAETVPLVNVGQRVQPGDPIASGGSAEVGFLIGGQPTPLVGGLGASTQPTQAGNDFLAFVRALAGVT